MRAFSSYPDHVIMKMPNLSPTMTKGNLGAWSAKIGDKLEAGDVLCSVETDKAVMDFEMLEEGYVAKFLVAEGTKDIPLGTPIAIVVDDKADVAAFKDFTVGQETEAPQESAPPKEEAAATPAPAKPAAAAPAATGGDRIFASPLAQKDAASKGIDLSALTGTGPNGRIIKADIDDAVAAGTGAVAAQKPAPVSMPTFETPAEFIDIPHT